MRVTQANTFQASVRQVRQVQEALAVAQERVSTGRRINRPSDDPVGVRAAAVLKDSIAASERYQQNIARSRGRTSAVESALTSAANLVVEAGVIAIAGSTTSTGDEIQSLAAQVEALFAQVLAEANAKVGGAFVFGGYKANSEPFRFAGFTEGVATPPVVFSGDTNEVEVGVDDGVRLPVTLNGQRVFLGDSDGDGTTDPGKHDVFEVLGRLRDALRAADFPAIRQAAGDLSEARSQLQGEVTRIGSISSQIDLWEDRQSLRNAELRSQLSSVEDIVDVEAITDLLRQEAALTATLSATARLLQPNLLNFL